MKVEKLVEYTVLQLFLWALRLAGWQICSCVDHYQPQRDSVYLSQGERLVKQAIVNVYLMHRNWSAQPMETAVSAWITLV